MNDCELAFDGISDLDFSLIKRKLGEPEEGTGWAPEVCDAVEQEYRRFLALKRAYPNREIVPNRAVDRFWHQHILDTQRYGEDCNQVFGYFLHHYPYFGIFGPEDAKNLKDAFSETAALYEQHFGESYDAAAARCRTQCKPVRCK